MKLSEKPIIIIGGGPAGYTSALEIRKKFPEQKIILIEKNKLGGTCLHLGCIPSKQLHSIERLEDFPRLLIKNKMILEKAIASELKAAEIEVIFTEATIEGSKIKLSSNGSPRHPSSLRDGEAPRDDTDLEYSHLVLATGSRPRTLKEFPQALTSDSFFSEENLAKGFSDKYCFIGGGYIGVELASMLAQHGKQVRIIEAQDNILSFLDKDVHSKLLQSLKAQKIKIETGVKDLSSIVLEPGEEVFVSVGREANLLPSTEHQALNTHIIGDASGEIALAHYAYAQAKQLAAKLAGEEYIIDKTKVPLVIFTHPEVASIGLTEEQAKQKYDIKILPEKLPDARHASSENAELTNASMSSSRNEHNNADGTLQVGSRIMNWASNGKARISGYDRGMTKWVIYNDRVIGCHIIGEHATDLISIIVPIINMNPTITEMQRWIYPHPTLGEIMSF